METTKDMVQGFTVLKNKEYMLNKKYILYSEKFSSYVLHDKEKVAKLDKMVQFQNYL